MVGIILGQLLFGFFLRIVLAPFFFFFFWISLIPVPGSSPKYDFLENFPLINILSS